VFGEIAAQLAAITAEVIAGLRGHRQLVTRCPDSFQCRLQQRVGDGARIRAAHCFAAPFDGNHHLDGVGRRLTEYRAEQADDKILRGVFVVVKNELNVSRLNAVHRETPEMIPVSLPDEMEQIKNNSR
jgi:hypothetical protein